MESLPGIFSLPWNLFHSLRRLDVDADILPCPVNERGGETASLRIGLMAYFLP